MEIPLASSADRSGKRGVRGRESGTWCRVSPRTAEPWNTSAVKHARAKSYWLGTGEGERKCDGFFPQKSGKNPRISAALFPPARACRRAQPNRRPNLAPAPCRTQGGWGAADTPPASHTVRIPPTDTLRLRNHNTFHLETTIHRIPTEEKREEKRMAEREGFEPSERFPPRRFSKPVLSATQPSLR